MKTSIAASIDWIYLMRMYKCIEYTIINTYILLLRSLSIDTEHNIINMMTNYTNHYFKKRTIKTHSATYTNKHCFFKIKKAFFGICLTNRGTVPCTDTSKDERGIPKVFPFGYHQCRNTFACTYLLVCDPELRWAGDCSVRTAGEKRLLLNAHAWSWTP